MKPGSIAGEIPRHFVLERDVAAMQLLAARGLETGADLKLAHWRGQFDLVKTLPSADYHVMTFLLGGASIHRMDARAEPARKRAVVYQPCQSSAVWTSNGPTEYVQLYFRAGLLEEAARHLSARSGTSDGDPEIGCFFDAGLTSIVGQCAATLLADRHVSRLELDGWAQVISAYFLRSHARLTALQMESGRRESPRHPIRKALDYIEDNLDRDVSLRQLAELCDLSPWYLSRLFKKVTGDSPHQYLLSRRINRARELLVSGQDLPLAQIALDAGFCSQAHLTSTFKRYTGVTPGQFRRDRKS